MLQKAFLPAVPVPINKKGEIDLDALNNYSKHMDSQPISGVALWVHTGRGLMLNEKDRERVYAVWRKNLSNEKIIVCGVGARNTEIQDEEYINEAEKMCRHAKDLGANAALCFAPVRFKGSAEKVLEYHRQIAKANLPIMLFYLYEQSGGISYDSQTLLELLSLPEVIGIKMATLDSVMTFQNVARIIKNDFPGICLVTGEDRFFGYSVALGAKGALVGLGAVFQQLQSEMMNDYWKKDYKSFVDKMSAVDFLSECIFCDPMEAYIERLLYTLSLEGIIPSDAVNDPWGPGICESQKKAIENTLEQLKKYS